MKAATRAIGPAAILGLYALSAGAGVAEAQDLGGQAVAGATAPAVRIGRAVDLAGTPVALLRPRTLPVLPGKPAALAPTTGFAMPAGMPVAARALTSGFGSRVHPLLNERRAHLGIDLAASSGTPIVATSPGVVSAEGWYGGYGDLVVINHGAGVETRYGHMSRSNVVAGQRVQRGDVIGYVGSTGLATGPHLHYEVRIDGQPINPLRTLGGR